MGSGVESGSWDALDVGCRVTWGAGAGSTLVWVVGGGERYVGR